MGSTQKQRLSVEGQSWVAFCRGVVLGTGDTKLLFACVYIHAGGLSAVQAANEAKAKLLYDAIDNSNGFYNNPVDPAVRSLMNVPFTIPSNPDLEKVRRCIRCQAMHVAFM